MEDLWEEEEVEEEEAGKIFGEKEAVFLELLSSCRFAPASLSVG